MMKKTTFLFAFAFIAASAFAQDITSKKGELYLPETGDWAISIDGSSFLKYAGNFIGGNGENEAPKFDFLSNNQTIIGKYFTSPNTAYRFGACLGFATTSNTDIVPAIPSNGTITTVDNVSKFSNTNIGLTLGKEWRKGKTRLQGFYGAEAGVGLRTSIRKNTFGNALSTFNPVGRQTEIKNGSTFNIGVRGFVGAEYFIFPKIALGGEFGWGLVFSSQGQGSAKTDNWIGNSVNTQVTKTGGASTFSASTDQLNSIFGSAGTIRLTLHF